MIIDKIREANQKETIRIKNEKASDKMIGKWVKCENCKDIIYKEDLHNNLSVCPNCGKHFRLSARRRIKQIADEGTFEEIGKDILTKDPLKFDGYLKKVELLKEKTKIQEAVKCGKCKINGEEVVLAVMDGNFLMGSMGSAVGEKIVLAAETSLKEKLPLILFCVSGGARMQEGIISLMQMARTSRAIAKLGEEGILYISVLTDPTGFAGPRVIEQTIKQKLPDGFQRSEFLLERGFIDKIVERKDMKSTLAKIIRLHTSEVKQ